MTGGLRSGLSAVAQPALRAWGRVPMRVQGRITVGLPLVAVVISACLAIVGNAQRVEIEADIQRKFETSGALGELTSLMVNAETGMRGYLLTRQQEYLEPFDQASRELPGAMGRLTALASAEPGEAPRSTKLGRLRHLQGLIDQQIGDLAFQRSFVQGGGAADAPELRRHLAYGKDLMDRLRDDVDAMRSEERALLDERIDDINAIRVRDYLSVALALVAAVVMRFLAWYLFRNGIVRRVERLTGYLRSLRTGGEPPRPLPAKNDQMGELEREVDGLDVDALRATGRTPSASGPPPASDGVRAAERDPAT